MGKIPSFGEFLRNRRMEKGIEAEKLSEGLYDSTMLILIEKGERVPSRLMMDRLLDRLGVSVDDYELFLDYDEYDRWLERQRLVEAVLNENVEKAWELLSQYRRNNNMGFKLCRQFYLAMKAQCMQLSGEEESRIAQAYEEAVRLTVPDVDTKPIKELVLSAQELNLILEYAYYGRKRDFDLICREMLEYIRENHFDIHNKSKIYPKIVFYMYLYIREQDTDAKEDKYTWDKYMECLLLCNEAVEILRDSTRTYYLIELLESRMDIITFLLEHGMCPKRLLVSFDTWMKESCEWKKAYESLYNKFGISMYMRNCMQFYLEGAAFCISDVIRIRRKMLGLSAARLAEGICSEKTIRRIENRRCRTHREITSELLARMGIPYQLHRTDVITSNYGAKKIKEQLDDYAVRMNYGKSRECIEQLETLIDMDIPINRQTMLRVGLNNEWAHRGLGSEEYEDGLMEALGYTIPYNKVIESDECYLTNAELMCIYNISLTRLQGRGNEPLHLLYKLMRNFEQNIPVHSDIMTYELVMRTMSGYLGNMGEYDSSNTISDHVTTLCLRCRRTHIISKCIYNNQWNSKMREGRSSYNSFEKEEIDKAIMVSRFCKDEVQEKFYKSKRDG